MLWSSTSHVLFTPFTFLTILAIEVHITWDLSGTSNCLTQGRNCQFGIDVSSFKYEAKKLKRLIFLLLGFGGFSLFFLYFVWDFFAEWYGFVWFGFWGCCGGVACYLLQDFFFYVSGNGTYSSTTGQFSHMENVSSLFWSMPAALIQDSAWHLMQSSLALCKFSNCWQSFLIPK